MSDERDTAETPTLFDPWHFAQRLEDADGTLENFAALLKEGLTMKTFSLRDIADLADTTVATVKRWSDGEVSPHPTLRAPILGLLAKKVRASLYAD